MDWLLLIVGTLLAVWMIRAVATAVHEFGHAIAALLFTKEKVSVYLGSYGDEQNSKSISFGRFQLWFRFNPLKSKGGLCMYAADCSLQQRYLIILAGPMASLLLAVAVLGGYFMASPEGLIAPFLLMLGIWSGLIFLYNIVPGAELLTLKGGEQTYNDGAKLRMMRLTKKMSPDYDSAVEHFNAGRYSEAAVLFDKVIEEGTKNEFVYRLAVTANIQMKNFQKADTLQKEQVSKLGKLNSEDRINMALLKTYLGKYDEAVKYYEHLLSTGGSNKYNLNNFGYTLTLIGEYQQAISHLDKAIGIDADFAYAYTNRAFAKMMLGRMEEGKADNDRALELDPGSAYAHRNVGIYLIDKARYSEALESLNKAREIDNDIPSLNYYFTMAHARLGIVSAS